MFGLSQPGLNMSGAIGSESVTLAPVNGSVLI
jgi:hypothetical protein